MKKLVTGLMFLGAISQTQAQVLECKAKVLKTVCGSGEILVSIDLKTNEVKMRLGAVPCWGTDLEFKGMATLRESSRFYYQAVNYDLSGQRFREEQKKIGSLVVQDGVALLDIDFENDRDFVLYRHQFNLVCEEKSGELE